MMKFDVYTCNEKQLNKIGEVTTLYDRIVHVNCAMIPPKKKVINKETAYPFTIHKISRADIPYRQFRLTHLLSCNELASTGFCELHIKLSALQCLRIAYYHKTLIWQTKKFWNKIYHLISGYLVVAILGGLVTLFALKASKHESFSNKKEKETINAQNEKYYEGDTSQLRKASDSIKLKH